MRVMKARACIRCTCMHTDNDSKQREIQAAIKICSQHLGVAAGRASAGAVASNIIGKAAAFLDLLLTPPEVELPPLVVCALAEVDFDAAVVDDDVVHLLIRHLCRLLRFELDEGIVERVARLSVPDDVGLHMYSYVCI